MSHIQVTIIFLLIVTVLIAVTMLPLFKNITNNFDKANYIINQFNNSIEVE